MDPADRHSHWSYRIAIPRKKRGLSGVNWRGSRSCVDEPRRRAPFERCLACFDDFTTLRDAARQMILPP